MKSFYLVIVLVYTALLFGCSNNDEDPKGVVTDYQKEALEKAKDVENVLRDADQKTREAIDSQ